MTDDSKDCWQCRLISGGGLIGAGAYVVQCSKKLNSYSRYIVTAFGYGVATVGAMRLLGIPPFKTRRKTGGDSPATVDRPKEDDEDYIIGKFS